MPESGGGDRFSAHRLPRGRHGLPPGHVAESQRLRLSLAAGEVLRARGFNGVTSREVCRRAGISTATFYEHFGDVDACLHGAYEMTADSIWELVSAACTGRGSWTERLRAALDAAVAFLTAEPPLARLLGPDLSAGVPAVAAAQQRLLGRLAGLLCSGRALRLETADRLIAGTEAHLTAGAAALLGDRIVAGELDRLPTLVPPLAELLAGPYVGESSAR